MVANSATLQIGEVLMPKKIKSLVVYSANYLQRVVLSQSLSPDITDFSKTS
jgi:hypothetical protein